MSELFTLWAVSWIMAGAALAIMLALIAARAVNRVIVRRREADRRRLVPLLLGGTADAAALATARRAGDLLTDLSTELVQLVSGSDKQNFVAGAARLGVPDRLARRMASRTARVRLTAVEALADFPGVATLDRLRRALDDRNADVRLAAALALASTGHAPPVRELIARLDIGGAEHSLLVVTAFRDIARTRGDEIRGLIADAAQPPMVRAAAIEALADSGDYTLVPDIAALVLDAPEGADEIPRFLQALGTLAHPAGAGAVVHALASADWRARAAAAQAAGRIGLRAAGPRLVALLADPEWWVRFRAGEALAALGRPGIAQLVETACMGSTVARTAATLTLAERGLGRDGAPLPRAAAGAGSAVEAAPLTGMPPATPTGNGA